MQPGLGIAPVSFSRWNRNAEEWRCFFIRHPDEVSEFHQARLDLVLPSQPVKSLIDGQKLIVLFRGRQVDILKIHTLVATAMTKPMLPPRVFYEDAPHCFGCGAEEVGAILKLHLSILTHQSQPCFVNKRGRLQRLARGFASHPMRRKLTEFIINERKQLIRSFGISAFDRLENLGDVAHFSRSSTG